MISKIWCKLLGHTWEFNHTFEGCKDHFTRRCLRCGLSQTNINKVWIND